MGCFDYNTEVVDNSMHKEIQRSEINRDGEESCMRFVLLGRTTGLKERKDNRDIRSTALTDRPANR